MEPANLLFIVSDNHQRDYVGAYGHPLVKTPNIDRIATNGLRFENAYAGSAVCCPARAAMATGRFPHQTGYWDNVSVYDGLVPSWHHRLRAAGHEVTSIGKLHYIGEGDDYGFTDSQLAMHIVDRKGALFGLLRATDEGERPRQTPRDNYSNNGVGLPDYVTYDQKITQAACNWLRQHQTPSAKPWALKVSYATPHPPFLVPQRLLDMYPVSDVSMPPGLADGERPTHPAFLHLIRVHSFEGLADESFVRRVVASYCALITFMDEQVGCLLREIADLGLAETTRIVYVSDHGEAAGHHGHFGKSNCYDHSVAIPLVASGPGIPIGQSIDKPVSHVDLFPTFLESLGVAPDAEDADLYGDSLWRVASGEVASRPVFCEYHGHGSKNGMFMLRESNMKLIYHVAMPPQLFDLRDDPDELNDLASSPLHADIRQHLENLLRAMVDPEEIDRRAKSDQRAAIKRNGGVDAILNGGSYRYNPVPGKAVAITEFENSTNS